MPPYNSASFFVRPAGRFCSNNMVAKEVIMISMSKSYRALEIFDLDVPET